MEIKIYSWRDGRCPVPRIRDATARVPPGFGARAFTLIELLVVIVIIAVLMGIAFPVFSSIQNQAKKTQAKNDLTQIVTAVNAFYTEYGKYPLPAAATGDGYPVGGSGASSKPIFDALRGLDPVLNPRQIVFISPPDTKDPNNPRSGIGTTTGLGQFYDPWGIPYAMSIDADYDNQVPNPYTADTGAGSAKIRQGVIAWSSGKDQKGGSGNKTSKDSNDDVISWQ
jgi:prepilin-type N-terminal cleavage/methylation domain-containing protein